MVLVGVCSDDPKRIMEIIRKNRGRKHFEPIEAVKEKNLLSLRIRIEKYTLFQWIFKHQKYHFLIS